MAMIAKQCPDIEVHVVDLNQTRIDQWNSDELPIYEPGLDEIVKEARGRNLTFSTQVEAAISEAATRACRELGYTRMWSIHPNQIRNIVDAFAPSVAEVDMAIEIITAAQAALWAPIRHHNSLHDRASYRYFWQVLERAQRTGGPLPVEARLAFFPDSAS